MLKRKMTDKLNAWKREGATKALFLVGARQVGKSYVIRAFGTREFSCYQEINLLENEPARRALEGARTAQDFITRVSLFSSGPLVESDTLIFIDEVQEAPDIMTMAKFLVEDGRFSWAFSGSMLGTELKGARSYPVGYVHELTMRPLDFEEFCWAINISDAAMGTVREAVDRRIPVEDFLHDAMLANFRTYLVVGGMPEVVERFLQTRGDLAAVRQLQGELNAQYRRDISKYAGSRALNVQAIFDQLPIQLEHESQRFMLNSVDPKARYKKFEQDFAWLVNAGVALKTNLVREPKQPLLQSERAMHFKLYQSDVGMLMARYSQATARSAYLGESGPNLGVMHENAVAQELAALGCPLHYYLTKKRGEVDFIVEAADGTVVPVEVKSGGSYRAHAALNHVMESPEYGVERGVVLCRGNVERAGGVVYLPHYAVFCLADALGLKEEPGFRLEIHRV